MLFRRVVYRLNGLLRAELALVAGYQKTLGVLKRRAAAENDHILRLASEHQRTVAALHAFVQARGGAPVIAPDPWEGCSGAGILQECTAGIFEDREFIGALLEVEHRGLADYEAALSSLDPDARELVELELIPRQRKHVAALSAMLVNLAA